MYIKRVYAKELFTVLMNTFDQLSEKITELANSGIIEELMTQGFEMKKPSPTDEKDDHRAVR